MPVLQYECQIWGMHSPRVAAANDARAALQRLHDYYLRTICRLLPSTPRRLILTDLGLFAFASVLVAPNSAVLV